MDGTLEGKLAFIGAGNMAEAILGGILDRAVLFPENIVVTDVRQERLDFFHKTYGVRVSRDNAGAAREADLLVLAVKPQDVPGLLGEIKGALDRERTGILSIAAGISTARIEGILGDGVRVVRAMPNTAALVGAGAAAICGGRWAGESDLRSAEVLLEAVGIVVRLAEDQMNAVTAVSGSGPAYVFFLIEAMLKAAREMGIPEETARALVLETVEGAAKLCKETGDDPAALRERVTSKGGTTAAALEVLRSRGVFDALVAAVKAAQARSKELSQS